MNWVKGYIVLLIIFSLSACSRGQMKQHLQIEANVKITQKVVTVYGTSTLMKGAKVKAVLKDTNIDEIYTDVSAKTGEDGEFTITLQRPPEEAVKA